MRARTAAALSVEPSGAIAILSAAAPELPDLVDQAVRTYPSVDAARASVRAAGADVNAVGGDGKDALSLAIFDGNYDVASFLVDSHANVNQADAQNFTPLFWAVDRRNMETAPNFPWMQTRDPMYLIRKLLDAGANPNAVVNNSRLRGSMSPQRIPWKVTSK